MNTQKIIKELQQKYPGKKIILNPSENPTEIICELSPSSDHPERSIALAIVGSSKPHYQSLTQVKVRFGLNHQISLKEDFPS